MFYTLLISQEIRPRGIRYRVAPLLRRLEGLGRFLSWIASIHPVKFTLHLCSVPQGQIPMGSINWSPCPWLWFGSATWRAAREQKIGGETGWVFVT